MAEHTCFRAVIVDTVLYMVGERKNNRPAWKEEAIAYLITAGDCAETTDTVSDMVLGS